MNTSKFVLFYLFFNVAQECGLFLFYLSLLIEFDLLYYFEYRYFMFVFSNKYQVYRLTIVPMSLKTFAIRVWSLAKNLFLGDPFLADDTITFTKRCLIHFSTYAFSRGHFPMTFNCVCLYALQITSTRPKNIIICCIILINLN